MHELYDRILNKKLLKDLWNIAICYLYNANGSGLVYPAPYGDLADCVRKSKWVIKNDLEIWYIPTK